MRNKENEKIDFVITWVDGNDTKWLEERRSFLKEDLGLSSSSNRFRDWDNLRYWFRGVEKFSPWVNNIYFITYEHVPYWLNVENPKLKIITHKSYIPNEFLPTYNSNVIELFINKIEGLSENFVLFNDDMFIIKNVKETDFFINNIPCDTCIHNNIIPFGTEDKFPHTMINNIDIINKNFRKRIDMRRNFFKHINYKYGIHCLRTIFLLPWYAYTGFYNQHIPVSYNKKTFNEVWDKEYERLLRCCKNKFRDYSDVSHWLMRYWQFAKGNIVPRRNNIGKMIVANEDVSELKKVIKKKSCKFVCINDDNLNIDFEKAKKEISNTFNEILSEKSSFEK